MLELAQPRPAAPGASQGIGGARATFERCLGPVTRGRFTVTCRLLAVTGRLRTVNRGALSVGLSVLTITRRSQDDLLAGWGRLTGVLGEQPAELGVTLSRLPVTYGRCGIPCLGGKVTGVGGGIAVGGRVVSFTGGGVSLARGVQPRAGCPCASQLAVVVISSSGACRQVTVAGGLIGVCRQLVAIGGDLVAVRAALVTVSARLLAVCLCLLVVSPGLVDV